MRYRVVGWTCAFNEELEEGETSESVEQAIIADIREHGWDLCGMDHAYGSFGVPVFNDGKMRVYSERVFGAIMAIAKGDLSPDGYIDYAFAWDDDWFSEKAKPLPGEVCPFDPQGFVPETDLNEEFFISVDEDFLKDAEEGRIIVAEAEVLARIDKGDTLVLNVSHNSYRFLVTGVERGWIEKEKYEGLVRRIPGALPHEVLRKEVERYVDVVYATEIKVSRIA